MQTFNSQVNKKADYILQVKGNQQTLLDDIPLYFKEEVFPKEKQELEAENRYCRELCFEHGRVEVREYYVENDTGWLTRSCPGWEGLSGIGACISKVTEKGKTTEAVSCSAYSCKGMTAEAYGKREACTLGDREQPALGA